MSRTRTLVGLVAASAVTLMGGLMPVSAHAAPGDPGVISGTATLPAGVDPTCIEAVVYAQNPITKGWEPTKAKTGLDVAGKYNLQDMALATYRIGFRFSEVYCPTADQSAKTATQFFKTGGDVATVDQAESITLTAGSPTKTVDPLLVKASMITGKVVDGAGNAISSAEVQAFVKDGTSWIKADSAGAIAPGGSPAGTFVMNKLLPGTPYVLKIYDTAGNYLAEYYDNVLTPDAAKPVSFVDPGGVQPVGNIVLTKGAKLSGKVTKNDGTAAPDLNVLIYVKNASGVYEKLKEGGTDVSLNKTAADGTYSYKLLRAGTYKIEVLGGPTTPYYYGDATALDKAAEITVAEAADVTGKDIKFPAPVVVPPPATTPPPPATVTPPASLTVGVTNWGRPAIRGKAKVRKTLRATTGSWGPAAGVSFTYTWFVGKTQVASGTASTLKLKKKYAGKKVTVAVTATLQGAPPVTVKSRATAKVAR